MRIRGAEIGEAAALTAIAFESKRHWGYPSEQLTAWSEDLTVLPEAIASSAVYLAEDGEGVAGFYVLEPCPSLWSLEHFWVLPSRMGRGIGRALLAHALSVAVEGGADGIEIDADPNAEPFYLACGARRVGSLAAPIEGAPDRERPLLVLGSPS